MLIAATGCSGEPALYPAAGRVVFPDGAPVIGAVIEFAPVAGGPAARAELDGNGRFELSTAGRRGAVAGEHRVVVVQSVVADGLPGHAHRHAGFRLVHPRYRRFETSGLAQTIGPHRDNVLVVEVEPDR